MYAFSEEKYVALAMGTTNGKILSSLVTEQWYSWLDIVENAIWLTNWIHSDIYEYNDDYYVCVPSGTDVISHKWRRAKIASTIYASAVWGYGLSGWLRKHDYNSPLYTILKAQNNTSIYRNNVCDPYIQNIKIPWEYSTLDKWLEPLWQQTFITK